MRLVISQGSVSFTTGKAAATVTPKEGGGDVQAADKDFH